VDSIIHLFVTEVNKNSGNLDEIKYLYYKRIQYKDVENYKWNGCIKKCNSRRLDYCILFWIYGKTYFMLDGKVVITNENVFNRYITDKYYINYWFTN